MGRKDKEEPQSDFITIVDSVEKEIPDQRPPFDMILYDWVPEVDSKETARQDDHASAHCK